MSGSHFRSLARRSVDMPASLVRSGDQAAEQVQIKNLSLNGACVESAHPLPEAATITLEIVAPTLWDPVELRGRVIWSDGSSDGSPRAGIVFEHQDASLVFALFELLAEQNYDL